jgi:hypothetical protein
MLSKVLRLLILIIACFSCKINSSKQFPNYEAERLDCTLSQKEFEIAAESFKDFNLQLTDFLAAKNKYDILKIFMKGGNHKKSFLKRWFLNEKNMWVELHRGNEKVTKREVSKRSDEIENLMSLVEEGSFMQSCEYQSNNDTYLLLIQENGIIKFQYLSVNLDYKALSDSDKNKIDNAVKLFSFFEVGSF